MDLARLQNLIKRDPRAYKEDFDQQYKHFKSQLEIFKLKPKENPKQFSSLIRFISAVIKFPLYIHIWIKQPQGMRIFQRRIKNFPIRYYDSA